MISVSFSCPLNLELAVCETEVTSMMIFRAVVSLLHALLFGSILTFAPGAIVCLIVPAPVSMWIVACIWLLFFFVCLDMPYDRADRVRL